MPDPQATAPHPRRPLRIAHRGYRTIAEENSLRQIEHALALGCDMVEVDVRRRADRALVLDHDDAARAGAPLLVDALALLAAAPNGTANLDLKDGGIGSDVVAAVRETGMLGRTTCTGGGWEQLAAIRREEPGIRIGLTVPRRSLPALPGLRAAAARAARPRLAAALPGLLAEHGADLVTVNWRLVDAAVVRAVHEAGAELWTWTVDRRRTLRRLEALGVDGVCSNLPESHGLVRR